MAETIKESKKVAPYMVVFLVHPIQVGVGVLGYQAILVKNAGHDSWIAVLFAGVGVGFVLWVIYMILNKGSGGGLISIHKEVFGKWLGGALSIVFIIFFLFSSVVVLRTYAEVVQVWMFPEMKTWVVSLLILFLAYYTIIGGLRAVIGICFFGFFVPFLGVTPALFYIIGFGNFHNLLPIWNHSLPDILKATKDMTLTVMGFQYILIAYPFIQKPRSSQKWAHYSNGFTVLVYLFITVLTIAYYNKEQIQELIWPTLSMLKIVHFSFLERFEYFAICLWLMVILPIIALSLWAASRSTKVLCGWKQKYVLPLFIVAAFVLSLFFKDRQDVDLLNNTLSMLGFYLLFLYLPFLLISQRILAKVRKNA